MAFDNTWDQEDAWWRENYGGRPYATGRNYEEFRDGDWHKDPTADLGRRRGCMKRRGDRIEQPLPGGSQFHPARAARQHALAQPFFQQAHAVAQRADGQVHRFSGAGQIAQPCGGDESIDLVQRKSAHRAPWGWSGQP